MKVLILVCAILALGTAFRDATEDEIEMIFEKVLEDEGMTLTGAEYDYRLAAFTLAYLAGDTDDGVNLEMMYDLDELAKQNGAKLIPTLKSELQEELQKRGVEPFSSPAPAYFRPLAVNEAVHQGVCGNCYLHTFIAALEVAYFQKTGKKLKFSEQELTDCYNNGCEGGDYRMVSVMMSYLDKMSSKALYGAYKSKQLTCRAGTTPDSLAAVKVDGYLDVPGQVSKIESAISTYGSVMTCMKWGSAAGEPCYMSNYKAGQIVDYPEYPGGCDHAVLIVGYTPTYWLVRNSHGKDWGERGHFRIKKGINSCGIEQNMAVVVVSARTAAKSVAPNGCPLSKPNLCTVSHACTGGSGCARPISLVEEKEVVEEIVAEKEVVEEVEERENRLPGELEKRDVRVPGEKVKREVRVPGEREKRDEEEKRFRGGAESNLGKREEDRRRPKNNRGKNPEDNPYMPGKLARLLQKRGLISEEDVIEYFEKDKEEEVEQTEEIVRTKRCADRTSQCKVLAARGTDVCSARMVAHCQATCKKCSAAPAPRPTDNGEVQGKCLTPAIANGRVGNGRSMNPGEPLNVRCNPGYTLVGGTSKCLIQDVFTNEDKDARLVPECIKLGSSTLSGNGATYTGGRNTYSAKDAYGREVKMECDRWNKDVLRGILMGYADGKDLLLGNHNYCRNPGGIEPVPFCLASATGVGKIVYCFGHGGCDTCAGATDKYEADYCADPRNTRFCLYTDKSTANRVAAIQENCAATCCKMAKC